jgi:hypothetical protein
LVLLAMRNKLLSDSYASGWTIIGTQQMCRWRRGAYQSILGGGAYRRW